jgi:hypothetical protein
MGTAVFRVGTSKRKEDCFFRLTVDIRKFLKKDGYQVARYDVENGFFNYHVGIPNQNLQMAIVDEVQKFCKKNNIEFGKPSEDRAGSTANINLFNFNSDEKKEEKEKETTTETTPAAKNAAEGV